MVQKGYKPSEVIQKYLKNKLHKSAKSKMTPSLDRRMKVYVLDKISQSMADLVYFLEQIAAHPELEKAFRQDLMDLFDMRPERDVKQLHPYFGVQMEGIRLQETAFTRLVFASVLPHDEHFLTYRLRMLHTLQSIVYAKSKFVLDNNFGVYNQATKSSLEDMAKSMGWTAMIGKYEIDPEYEPKRVLKLPSPYSKIK